MYETVLLFIKCSGEIVCYGKIYYLYTCCLSGMMALFSFRKHWCHHQASRCYHAPFLPSSDRFGCVWMVNEATALYPNRLCWMGYRAMPRYIYRFVRCQWWPILETDDGNGVERAGVSPPPMPPNHVHRRHQPEKKVRFCQYENLMACRKRIGSQNTCVKYLLRSSHKPFVAFNILSILAGLVPPPNSTIRLYMYIHCAYAIRTV